MFYCLKISYNKNTKLYCENVIQIKIKVVSNRDNSMRQSKCLRIKNWTWKLILTSLVPALVLGLNDLLPVFSLFKTNINQINTKLNITNICKNSASKLYKIICQIN